MNSKSKYFIQPFAYATLPTFFFYEDPVPRHFTLFYLAADVVFYESVLQFLNPLIPNLNHTQLQLLQLNNRMLEYEQLCYVDFVV